MVAEIRTANELRRCFTGFFEQRGHTKVESASLIPHDPSILFTVAGMVPFKPYFVGDEVAPFKRAVSVQKCARAGGKHNDLDDVGRTKRHCVFFEMLGNFSFGDYFKTDAIPWSWELVTEVFGFDGDQLWITVHESDDEAEQIWHDQVGVPMNRIQRLGDADNFWQMGETGPCGPCSEIHIDRGAAFGPDGGPKNDPKGDRFLEFWNLVFMQYEQVAPGERQPLPRPSIDTGMGLERISAILQGVTSNYETDLFRTLIRASVEATGVEAQGAQAASHRVIADHLRASSFLVADGVLPSNEGRGYVLRRIMRRAMRHAQLLGAKDPLMWRLVPALMREMGEAYPELLRAQALITETLRLEETRFRTTLARGLGILDDETRGMDKGASLNGETAFKLYDTYGFPLDLTQDALRARGISVDTDGFSAAMERQRAEARKAWAGSGEAATETVWFGIREKAGATEFLGYGAMQAEGVIAALVRDGKEVDRINAGETGYAVFNQTPCYGESGGQVGDTGALKAANAAAQILDTQKKLGDVFVHEVKVDSGALTIGLACELSVDVTRRKAIRANHSATHLLHEALRQVLGDHVAQKGSLVAQDRLRFDFAHPKPVSEEELVRVEDIANTYVLQNAPVETRLMAVDDAIESGARALFGEKYGDEVRVVSMGAIEGGGNAGRAFSVELCGGTHVSRTGEIGLVTITGEAAVASGVRRLEAKTADDARQYLNSEARRMRAVAGLLKTPVNDAAERLNALIEERRKLERELTDARKKLAMGGGASGAAGDEIADINGVKFIGRAISGVEMKDLKSLADESKAKIGSGVVAIINTSEDGKGGAVVAVTADLTARFNAVDLVRIASEKLGGKGGGGRPDMAQAGGPDGAQAQAAVDAIAAYLKEKAAG